jgi:hypothetical protein
LIQYATDVRQIRNATSVSFASHPRRDKTMRSRKTASALSLVAIGSVFANAVMADVIIPYNEYSESPSIGRGGGT